MKKLMLLGLVLFLTACNSVAQEEITEKVISKDEAGFEYQDPAIVEFLEENLGWTTELNGKVFCAYHLLKVEQEKLYMKAACEEFFVETEEVVCTSARDFKDCQEKRYKGVSADKCIGICEQRAISPHLLSASGTNQPVKLTHTKDNSFDLWRPGLGEGYWYSIESEFPAEILDKIRNRDTNYFISDRNIIRAEEYFKTPHKFHVRKETETMCETMFDCVELKEKQYRHHYCLKNKCVLGFFEFNPHPITREHTKLLVPLHKRK